MMPRSLAAVAGLLLAMVLVVPSPADTNDDGFVPMFNGRDLTGWVNVNCAPSTFFAKDGEVITTGKPTGFLRTTRQYENFIADFEWMHVNKTEVGNSGFFVWADPLPAVGTPYTRGIEVQVLVNLEYKDKRTGAVTATSHGDLFSIHGATCKPDRPHPLGWLRCLPSENRAKGGGEWNHYQVVANNGVIKLHVNGKEVSGISECRPRKGYLALESEGAECHFRNLKIKELPSTHPKPDEVAEEAKGFVNLYTGLDLSGWKADAGHQQHWRPNDSVLRCDGGGEAKDKDLWSAKEYGDFEMIADFRLPGRRGEAAPRTSCGLAVRGQRGGTLMVSSDGTMMTVNRQTWKPEGLKPAGQWNRIRVRMAGDQLTVSLNGKPAVENTQLGNVPTKGPVALHVDGGPVEFENIFVRELKK
jgi:hypothetical protein